MATLILANDRDRQALLTQHRVVALRQWLEGCWSAVFSHPADFAPHPSTPHGFVACLADCCLAANIKPIVLGDASEHLPESWFDHSVNDDTVVLLNANPASRIVDLAEPSLARTLAKLPRPFVALLDERGRCRSTLHYRAQSRDRPYTILDIVDWVAELRGDANPMASDANEQSA